jgi:DNA-binding transcriptional LysR family regulator
MVIDEHRLKIFCAVAESKSFIKAGNILLVTQPGISSHILALETFLGTKLINRTQSDEAWLTAAGEVLYKYAKKIIAQYASAKLAMADISHITKADIKIAAATIFENHILPKVVVDYYNCNPKISLDISASNTKRIYNLLQSGAVDLGIVDEVLLKRKFFVERLMFDELCFIISSRHPWARRKSISIREVARMPFIFREEESSTAQIVKKYFFSNGINPSYLNIPFTLSSPGAINDAVARRMGTSISSKWAIKREVLQGEIVTLPLKEGNIIREFYLVIQKNTMLSHTAKEFIAYLKSYPYDQRCAPMSHITALWLKSIWGDRTESPMPFKSGDECAPGA